MPSLKYNQMSVNLTSLTTREVVGLVAEEAEETFNDPMFRDLLTHITKTREWVMQAECKDSQVMVANNDLTFTLNQKQTTRLSFASTLCKARALTRVNAVLPTVKLN